MTRIINLSALINMPDGYTERVNKVVDGFAALSQKYQAKDLCHQTFFANTYANKAWIITQYLLYKTSVIDAYKLGKIKTPKFLDLMLDVFSFMRDVELTKDDEQLVELMSSSLWSHQHCQYDSQLSAKSLIERAWNRTIDLDDKHIERARELFLSATEENPVYLVSNSNELNIHCFLEQLRSAGIQLSKDIDIGCTNSLDPVAIAPNVYLCLSYRFQIFKVPGQLAASNYQTSSLIKCIATKTLSETVGGDLTTLIVTSQHQADRAEAKFLGLSDKHIMTPDDYFADQDVMAHVTTR